MAILAKLINDGMDAASYDRVSAYLVTQLTKQPGFMMHVAYPGSAGFYVEEVWQSRDHFEKWFNEMVLPNVPDVQQEIIELHAVARP